MAIEGARFVRPAEVASAPGKKEKWHDLKIDADGNPERVRDSKRKLAGLSGRGIGDFGIRTPGGNCAEALSVR